MMQHVWTVLCSRSVIDPDTNNMSLQNVIEQLTVSGEVKPEGRILCRMELTTLWCRPEDGVPTMGLARVTVESPAEEALGSTQYAVDLSVAPRYRQRTKFDFLPINTLGRYVFKVEQQRSDGDWRVEAQIPLQVLQKPAGADE